MQFNWIYVNLVCGNLIDEDDPTYFPFLLAPKFRNVNEANAWLERNDIRATCR